MKNIVILSGAGVSAESGIKTFRDADGLWEGHDVMEVASPQGWRDNKALVLDFYNQRRRQLKEVSPNAAHRYIADLDDHYNVHVVTQNVDDLHERAGSRQIIHLHGELTMMRSEKNEQIKSKIYEDIHLGDLAEDDAQWRPDIVWFGEEVPLLAKAANLVAQADIVIIIGTSLQVYPAAGLVAYAKKDSVIYYIDPKPKSNYELSHTDNVHIIQDLATIGMKKVYGILMADS